MTRIVYAALASFVLAGAPAALAQRGTSLGPIAAPGGGEGSGRQRKPEAPAPSGVPGARAEPELVAPAERVPTDMPPTEALFDAINRGDINATKEAIGRGADIHGRNVLGLTPTELAVDLGRNDISFLLLSLRGGAGYNSSALPRPTTASVPKTRAEIVAERRAEQQARRREAEAARASARNEPRTAAPARAARLFAGDGGNPVPQAGFLGFDSAR